jgi:hypothetical protein
MRANKRKRAGLLDAGAGLIGSVGPVEGGVKIGGSVTWAIAIQAPGRD